MWPWPQLEGLFSFGVLDVSILFPPKVADHVAYRASVEKLSVVCGYQYVFTCDLILS